MMANNNPLPVLTFLLGEQTYALPILQVVEVAAMVEMTDLVNARAEVIGAANRHGEVLPMLDLCQVMGLERVEYDDDTLFIVAQNDDRTLCGLIVNTVQQVQHIGREHITTNAASAYIQGISTHHAQLIQILDINAIMDAYLVRTHTVEGK